MSDGRQATDQWPPMTVEYLVLPFGPHLITRRLWGVAFQGSTLSIAVWRTLVNIRLPLRRGALLRPGAI